MDSPLLFIIFVCRFDDDDNDNDDDDDNDNDDDTGHGWTVETPNTAVFINDESSYSDAGIGPNDDDDDDDTCRDGSCRRHR